MEPQRVLLQKNELIHGAISFTEIDSEEHFHTADDEIETLDMNNMAGIIKSIEVSAQSIVNGKDKPARVDISQLR